MNIIRELGKKLYFQDTSVQGLLNQKERILNELSQNGVVCLKNVNFQPKQIQQFAEKMWDQLVYLPKFMKMNNIEQEYPLVARIGNLMYDGSIKDSSKQAIHWHQDGDFWGTGRNHIFTLLHTKILPETGGYTHFMDLVKAASFLKKNKPQIYQKLLNLVGQLNMEDIPVFKQHGVSKTLGIDSLSYHEMIKDFNQGKEQVLFGSVMRLLDKNTKEPVPDKIDDIHKILEHEMGYYQHIWEEGDLVIYDNLQLMHRASGIFTGNRLLLRIEARDISC